MMGVQKLADKKIVWWVRVLALGCTIVLSSCSASRKTYNPDKKLAPEAMQQDVSMLWETLQKCHPSLYWYNTKDSVDGAFNQLQSSLTDSLTELQFRMKLAKAVATIRCGHTSIRASKAAARYHENRNLPVFPLQMKLWEPDSMVILANVFRNDSNLRRGMTVHSINGHSVRQITDSIFPYMSADGWHESFKYQLLSTNFPAWYKSLFGLSERYTIDATDLSGKRRNYTIRNFYPAQADSLEKQNPERNQLVPAPKRPRHENERKLQIDTAKSLAILELNSFSTNGLRGFFRRSFRTIKKMGIKNLVIELRQNGGGNIMNSTRLTQYISDHRFKVADTVAAVSLKYPYPSMIKAGLIYKIQKWFVTSRRTDGRLHYRLYERKLYSPKTNNHFDGKVFVITGGFTFSASTLFINPIKGQPNVTILGEETGGNALGNTAINIPDVKLPNTGVRVRMPLYRLVASNQLPHDGRGIMPDIFIAPSSEHLRYLADPKMEKVYQLIKQP